MGKIKQFWLLGLVLLAAPFVAGAQVSSDHGVEEKGLEYLLFQEIPVVSSTGFFETEVVGFVKATISYF